MEFTKDIYFNDKLESGKKATITYSGALFQSGSEHVDIVYGFGQNWDCTTTQGMNKTDNGFLAEVEMKDYDVFNFCFSNENGIWDNNNYANYISQIEPAIIEITAPNDGEINYGTDYSASIDDIIEDILGNTVQNNIVNEKDANTVDKILESITKETLPEIEQLFTELFSAEYDRPVQVQETVAAAPDIDEDTNAELIKLFNELFESASEPEFFTNEAPKAQETVDIVAESQIIEDKPFELVQEIVKEEANLNVAAFNLDGLVSELLEPVINASIVNDSTLDEEISLFDDIKSHEDDEETALTVLDSRELLVSSRRLGSIYKFKKKIKLACYKLFVKIPKQLAKQLGFGQN